eukprot:tig00021293_g20011.t1
MNSGFEALFIAMEHAPVRPLFASAPQEPSVASTALVLLAQPSAPPLSVATSNSTGVGAAAAGATAAAAGETSGEPALEEAKAEEAEEAEEAAAGGDAGKGGAGMAARCAGDGGGERDGGGDGVEEGGEEEEEEEGGAGPSDAAPDSAPASPPVPSPAPGAPAAAGVVATAAGKAHGKKGGNKTKRRAKSKGGSKAKAPAAGPPAAAPAPAPDGATGASAAPPVAPPAPPGTLRGAACTRSEPGSAGGRPHAVSAFVLRAAGGARARARASSARGPSPGTSGPPQEAPAAAAHAAPPHALPEHPRQPQPMPPPAPAAGGELRRNTPRQVQHRFIKGGREGPGGQPRERTLSTGSEGSDGGLTAAAPPPAAPSGPAPPRVDQVHAPTRPRRGASLSPQDGGLLLAPPAPGPLPHLPHPNSGAHHTRRAAARAAAAAGGGAAAALSTPSSAGAPSPPPRPRRPGRPADGPASPACAPAPPPPRRPFRRERGPRATHARPGPQLELLRPGPDPGLLPAQLLLRTARPDALPAPALSLISQLPAATPSPAPRGGGPRGQGPPSRASLGSTSASTPRAGLPLTPSAPLSSPAPGAVPLPSLPARSAAASTPTSVPPRPPASGERRRPRGSGPDDAIIVPSYGAGRIEVLRHRDIYVPQWRVMSGEERAWYDPARRPALESARGTEASAAAEESEGEDTSDEAYDKRHEPLYSKERRGHRLTYKTPAETSDEAYMARHQGFERQERASWEARTGGEKKRRRQAQATPEQAAAASQAYLRKLRDLEARLLAEAAVAAPEEPDAALDALPASAGWRRAPPPPPHPLLPRRGARPAAAPGRPAAPRRLPAAPVDGGVHRSRDADSPLAPRATATAGAIAAMREARARRVAIDKRKASSLAALPPHLQPYEPPHRPPPPPLENYVIVPPRPDDPPFLIRLRKVPRLYGAGDAPAATTALYGAQAWTAYGAYGAGEEGEEEESEADLDSGSEGGGGEGSQLRAAPVVHAAASGPVAGRPIAVRISLRPLAGPAPLAVQAAPPPLRHRSPRQRAPQPERGAQAGLEGRAPAAPPEPTAGPGEAAAQ